MNRQHTCRLRGGGSDESCQDWRSRAAQLEEQVARLQDENKILHDLRTGNQRTLDSFLFKKRKLADPDTDCLTRPQYPVGNGKSASEEQPMPTQKATCYRTTGEHTVNNKATKNTSFFAKGHETNGNVGMSFDRGSGEECSHRERLEKDTILNVMSLSALENKEMSMAHMHAPSAESGIFHRLLSQDDAKAVGTRVLARIDRAIEAMKPTATGKSEEGGSLDSHTAASSYDSASNHQSAEHFAAPRESSAATKNSMDCESLRHNAQDSFMKTQKKTRHIPPPGYTLVKSSEDLTAVLQKNATQIFIGDGEYRCSNHMDVSKFAEVRASADALLLCSWRLHGEGGSFYATRMANGELPLLILANVLSLFGKVLNVCTVTVTVTVTVSVTLIATARTSRRQKILGTVLWCVRVCTCTRTCVFV